jgi:hypothetical protein
MRVKLMSLPAARRSARAWFTSWLKQPVKPPPPTVEQLSVPVRPT